jgi:hypothetical protein
MKAGGDSTVTVLVAFGANLAIAVAKTVAAQLSGSASMSAEAAHSWADTGNEIPAHRQPARQPGRTRGNAKRNAAMSACSSLVRP